MNMRHRRLSWLSTILIVSWACGTLFGRADEWPTFAHDAWRSAATEESLNLPLVERWVHRAAHPPTPAWPAPAKNDYWHYKQDLQPRETYDHAYHAVVAGGRVFYGTSTDDQIVCLDAATGQPCWSFFTEGPVRLSPTIVGDRLFAGSDDGCVYCLATTDGKLRWKTRIGPADSRCIGNGRIISRWPVRSGVLVRDGIAYCAAGIFPKSEGTFLVGLDAATGTCVLRQAIEQSVQGYMLLTDQQLLFPSGRTSPVVYDRRDGKHLGDLSSPGGAYTVITPDLVVAGRGDTQGELALIEPTSREQLITFDGRHIIARGKLLFVQNRTHLSALDRAKFLPLARRHAVLRNQLSTLEDRTDGAAKAEAAVLKTKITLLKADMNTCWVWRTPCEHAESLILAGGTLFAGGNGQVVACSAADGQLLWTGSVNGRACSLVVAQGQLIVSTDAGCIQCFQPQETPAQPLAEQRTPAQGAVAAGLNSADPASEESARLDDLARLLLAQSRVDQGFGLIIGAGHAALAPALASNSRLQLTVADPNGQVMDATRLALTRQLLYGVRAVVHQVDVAKLPYPPYFANMVLVDPDSVPLDPEITGHIRRVLRPSGGSAWIGGFAARDAAGLEAWKAALAGDGFGVQTVTLRDTSWVQLTRGRLAGAGEWTHGLADPANTACTMDQRVHGLLRIQWYGQPGPRLMADRHHRNVPPLYKDGRLFVPGENLVIAVDAYNGTHLWMREIPNSLRLGAFLDCGNLVVDSQALYVVAGDTCHVLDVATGEPSRQLVMPYQTPDQPRHWGYVARVDDLLVGSARRPDASYSRQSRADDAALWDDNMSLVTSDSLFALGAQEADPRWHYQSGVLVNTTITIGGGRVYFLESHSPQALENQLGRMPMSTFFEGPNFLVALDLHSGKTLWKQPLSLENCRHIVYANYAQEKLIISGNRYVDQKLWYFFQTLDASNGQTVWTASHNSGYDPRGEHGEQNRHPTIVGNTIYTYPLAYDLHTGQQLPGWKFDRLGHGCGNVSASANCIFWRGDNPWQWDLGPNGRPRRINTVTRPGCFINMVPAGGLLLIPEASSGCTCSFPLQTSLAYVPEEAN